MGVGPFAGLFNLPGGGLLAASTDGQGMVAAGNRGDVVLLDDNPLRRFEDPGAVAAHLRAIHVAATLLAGRATHLAI